MAIFQPDAGFLVPERCIAGHAALAASHGAVVQTGERFGLMKFGSRMDVFVPREAEGVKERPQWDALGMRATASHGIILENVFVPDSESLAMPGAFVKLMQSSRGSLMGNQPAISAIYLGAAKQAYDYALEKTMSMKFEDLEIGRIHGLHANGA